MRDRFRVQSVNFVDINVSFICLYRSRGLDVRKIVRMFTKDTGLNDSVGRQLCM